MPSITADTTAPRKSGGGIYVALIPWLLFTLAVQHSSLKLGSLLALVAAAAIALPGLRARRPKLLELGAVVTFIAFALVAFAADHSTGVWVARYARAIAAAALSLISFASLLFVPFTEQYARESVPSQFWGSPQFKETNRRLTLMWAAVFGAMVPFHVIAGLIDTTRGNLIFNWAVPLAMVVWAIKRSSAAGEAAAAPRQA
jgi:hypothetical protein